MTTAESILQAGLGHVRARASAYDRPSGQRSMWATVAAFNAITGLTLSEEQGWLLLTLLKAARSQAGEYRDDNYCDGAAIFALMGEAAAKERMQPQFEPVQIPAGFEAWHGGGDLPVGLVQVIYRNGARMVVSAEKMDWHRNDASPMFSDIMAYRRIVDGTEQPQPFYPAPPPIDSAPEKATHLMSLAQGQRGYAWGYEAAMDVYVDAEQLPELVTFDRSIWVAHELPAKKISTEALANSCATA